MRGGAAYRASAAVPWAAGRHTAPAHRPLSSTQEATGSCAEWSLVSAPPVSGRGRLGAAVSTLALGRAGPEDSTIRGNPAKQGPLYLRCSQAMWQYQPTSSRAELA